MIKVLIADDQELIRQSLQIVLNSKPDITVCDVAEDGQAVILQRTEGKTGYYPDGCAYAEDGRSTVYEDH